MKICGRTETVPHFGLGIKRSVYQLQTHVDCRPGRAVTSFHWTRRCMSMETYLKIAYPSHLSNSNSYNNTLDDVGKLHRIHIIISSQKYALVLELHHKNPVNYFWDIARMRVDFCFYNKTTYNFK